MHLYFQVKLRRRLSSTLRVPPPARLVPKLGGYAPNYYSMTTRVVSTNSLARGAWHQQLLDIAPTALLATSSRTERYKSTRMMTSANTEDPWIDSSIVLRLSGY
jgi:hypothetical protein